MEFGTAGLLTTAIALYAAQAGIATSSDPFFTNDAIGFIKVLVFFGGGWLILIGVVVKMAQSGIKNDVTNLGQKVDEKTREYDKEITRLDERVTSVSKETAGASHDVMVAMQQSGQEFMRALGEIQVEIARVQERDKLATELARLRADFNRDRGGA